MTRHSAQQGADLVNRMLAFSRRQQLQPDGGRARRRWPSTIDGLVAPVLGGLVRFEWQIDDDAVAGACRRRASSSSR